MKDIKLKIDLLPKGAWNNDLSKTLSKKEWDIIRQNCYAKANGRCEICGFETNDLNAHEIWEFDIDNQTQTLIDIIAICSKCHGVIHFKNSVRMGYGDNAKEHFIKVNNCSEIDFANQLAKATFEFNERNKVYRWEIIANLKNFGLNDSIHTSKFLPLIKNPYENIDFYKISFDEFKNLFKISQTKNLVGPPTITAIKVDNYQGIITVETLYADKIEWFLNNTKIKTKYNIVGRFISNFSVENLRGKIHFVLINKNGSIISKKFSLQEIDKN